MEIQNKFGNLSECDLNTLNTTTTTTTQKIQIKNNDKILNGKNYHQQLQQQQRPILNRKQISANWDQANIKKNCSKAFIIKSQITQLLTNCLAIDCEMVGVGKNGTENMLARVSIVNSNCDVVLDKFVKPQMDVVNYRTKVSGITPKNISDGEEFSTIQNEVATIIKNRIVIGHAVQHDFQVLGLNHPKRLIRDTSRYGLFKKKYSGGKTPSLKNLTKFILGVEIQSAEHNSIEDASAAMQIYNKHKQEWEKSIKLSRRGYDSFT